MKNFTFNKKFTLLKFNKFIFILCLGFLLSGLFKFNAFAYSRPSEFLQNHSAGAAQLIGDTFYFCQGDAVPTSQRYYRTVGFKIEVKLPSGTYGFSTPIDNRQSGIRGMIRASQESMNGLLWDLWSIGYYEIVNKLIQLYPNVDFSLLIDRNTLVEFIFSGYVTETKDWGASWSGTLYENGSVKDWVPCSDGVPSHKPFWYMSDDGWKNLRVSKKIGPGGDATKPKLPTVNTTEVKVNGRNPQTSHVSTYNGTQTLFVQPNANAIVEFTSTTSFDTEMARVTSQFYQMRDFYNNHVGTLRLNLGRLTAGYGTKDLSPNAHVSTNSASWDKHLSTINSNEVYTFRHDNGKTTSKYNLSFKEHAQAYYFYPAAQVKILDSDNIAADAGYFDNAKRLLIVSDGKAPTYNEFVVTDLGNNRFKITVKGVNDKNSGDKEIVPGSGVMGVNIILSDSTGELVWLDVPKAPSGFYEGTFDFSKYANNDLNISLWMMDNVRNEARFNNIHTINFKQNIESTIEDYLYKDSDGVKWTKADSPFSVKQYGYYKGDVVKSLGLYFNKSANNIFGSTTSDKGLSVLTDKSSGLVIDTSTNPNGFTFSSNEKGSNSKTYLVADNSIPSVIYDLYHNLTTNNSGYVGKVVSADDKLGIDNVGPSIDFDGNDKIKVVDEESGLNKINIPGIITNQPLKGKEQEVSFNWGNKTEIEVTVTDNVGNKTTITIAKGEQQKPSTPDNQDPSDKWEGNSSAYIKVSEVVKDNKRKLKVDVSVTVSAHKEYELTGSEYIYKDDGTFEVKDVYEWVTHPFNGKFVGSDGTVFNYTTSNVNGRTFNNTYYIDDIDNQPNGPTLSYETTSGDNRVVNVYDFEDLFHDYNFSVTGDAGGRNVISDSLSVRWCSRYNHFKFNLYRLTDDEFNVLSSPVTIFNNKKVPENNQILMSYLQTGRYKVQVTMFDFNGNPSGISELIFDHIQPDRYAQMEMDVTAVKDVLWEKENYPISYKAEESKFPLGKSYLFNGNNIAKGYAVNYNFAIPESLKYQNLKAIYAIYGIDGSGQEIPLKLTSNGESLSSLDSSKGTTFLKQTNNFIKKNDIVYMKHYLPSNVVAKDSSSRIYDGDIYVKVKVTADLRGNGNDFIDVGRISGIYKIYTYTQTRTAEDDLEVDKQR